MSSSMQELERTAVQLWEAKRLAEYEDVAHGRLALLLLDNAAETCLMRSAKSFLIYVEWYGNMAYQLRDAHLNDVEGQRLKSEIDAKTLSKRRRRQIERNFNDLVDYVFAQDSFGLKSEFAECLKILHRYRNAAYHRDTVWPDVLGPAVQIYFFLCCHLLKNERQLFHQIDLIPTPVAEIFGDQVPTSTWPGGTIDSATLGSELADFFLRTQGLDHAGVASALSAHLLGRLAAIDRHLTTIGESVPPGIKRWAVLQLLQQAPVKPSPLCVPPASPTGAPRTQAPNTSPSAPPATPAMRKPLSSSAICPTPEPAGKPPETPSSPAPQPTKPANAVRPHTISSSTNTTVPRRSVRLPKQIWPLFFDA